MADITKNRTSIGATAFNAPTNKDPNIVIHFTAYEIVIARIIPIIIPYLYIKLTCNFFIKLYIKARLYRLLLFFCRNNVEKGAKNMVKVKTVKIDGEEIHIFNSAVYILESSLGYTLDLDIIVSEVAAKKYRNEENLIVEMELEDSRMLTFYMNLKSLSGGLPQLNLFCEISDASEYSGFQIVNENDLSFPNIEAGITLDEIRKYEMPNEKVTLKLTLPIDQVEWLKKKKSKELSEIFKEVIYEYWGKNNHK